MRLSLAPASGAGTRPGEAPRRRGALAMTGILVAFPLLGLPARTTDPITVTFSGTPSTAGPTACPATPDITDLTVTAGTTVNFADEVGKPAVLWANDSSKHLLNDQMVPVTFTTGGITVLVKMLPDCPLDLGVHQEVKVVVQARATPSGGPSGEPSAGVAAPGDHNPLSTPPVSTSPVPSTPSTTDTAGRMRLAEPVSSSPAPRGASGLLTLIATVCIVGVGIAALRAVIAQRATRTYF